MNSKINYFDLFSFKNKLAIRLVVPWNDTQYISSAKKLSNDQNGPLNFPLES